jgi:hypothetical protein
LQEAKLIFLKHAHDLRKMGLTWEEARRRASLEEPGKSAWLAMQTIKAGEAPEDHPTIQKLRNRHAAIESMAA